MVTDDSKIQHIHFTCWITKVTDTHSECVIPLDFPWQQRLCKYASVLFYMYNVCRVEFQCVFCVKWLMLQLASTRLVGHSGVDLNCVSVCTDV